MTQTTNAIRAYNWMIDPDGADPGPLTTSPPPSAGVESEATVFETVTPLIPTKTGGEIDRSRSVSDAFDRCVESLGDLYRAYIVSEHDWRVQVPTRRTIAPIVPWTTVDPFEDEFRPGGMGLFLTNQGETNPVVPVGTMAQDRIQRMMSFARRQKLAAEYGDPLSLSLENLRRAQRSYHIDADYQACVVWAYAWSETLLDGVLLMSAWEEGIDSGAAAGWFGRGLIGRIGREYSSRFGGRWDLTLEDTPLGLWRSAVEDLRHKVMHLNHRPTEAEARNALEAGRGLQNFVLERLARSRKRYPRTALQWLGIEGLKQRRLFDAVVRKAYEDEEDDEPWLVQYRDYVADVRSKWRFS